MIFLKWIAGTLSLLALLLMVPLMTAFLMMIVFPPIYIGFFGGDLVLMVLSAFGIAGFTATVYTTKGLAAFTHWLAET